MSARRCAGVVVAAVAFAAVLGASGDASGRRFSLRLVDPVMGAPPKPVPGVVVQLWNASGETPVGEAATDAKGIVKFQGVRDQIVDVRTMRGGCPEVATRVDLAKENLKRPIDVAFPISGHLAVRFLEGAADGSAKPVPLARVDARIAPSSKTAPKAGVPAMQSRTARDLPAGEPFSICLNANVDFDMVFEVPGYMSTGLRTMRVAPGETKTVEVRLTKLVTASSRG